MVYDNGLVYAERATLTRFIWGDEKFFLKKCFQKN